MDGNFESCAAATVKEGAFTLNPIKQITAEVAGTIRTRGGLPFLYPAGVAFLLNPFVDSGDLPIQVCPNITLDKASPNESQVIKALVEELSSFTDRGLLFRCEPIPRDVRESPAWDRKLPPRETFWVMRFENNEISVERLCAVSQLCDSELELGAIFPVEGFFFPRALWDDNFFYYSQVHWRGDSQRLDRPDLARLQPLSIALAGFDASGVDPVRAAIARLIHRFVELSAGQRYGDLPLLGHFALLEGLLTHNPKASAGDSLTHQIGTKMPLVTRMFGSELRLTDYISESDPEKAWRLLYDVRCRIAHGEEPDYDRKHRCLRDGASVFRVVRESLKRSLVLALSEPQLISDLQKC